MRFAFSLVVTGIVLAASSPMAQETWPANPPAADDGQLGPVVGGRHRQPTEAEVEARERAEGESARAIEKRDRQEDKTIDDLYKELTKPAPLGAPSGEPGQVAR